MSAVRSLSGGKQTYRGRHISVAIDLQRTLGPDRRSAFALCQFCHSRGGSRLLYFGYATLVLNNGSHAAAHVPYAYTRAPIAWPLAVRAQQPAMPVIQPPIDSAGSRR